MSNKPELIEWLFINPKEFEKKFQELLNRVPNIHSPNKLEFFTHFFLGSVLTLAHTQLIKSENNIINNIFWKIIRDENDKIITLKLIFKVSDDGKNKLIFRTVTTAKDISLLQHYNSNELKELKKRALEGVFMNGCDIGGKIFHIHAAENLEDEEEDSNKDEKKGKSFKLKVEDLKVKESEGEEGEALHEALEKVRNLSTISEEFQEINLGSRNSSFDDFLSELSSLKIDKVKRAIEGIFNKLADIYKEHLDKTESAYHGFVYGFLAMNCKYRYDLDCYVERIEGKGYTDLILISRKGNKKNKNWNAIPVVVEFKAGTESVEKAIKQIKDRGYLYTPLSMRTFAKQGVITGVNFALSPGVVVEEVEIYQSQGFINELLNGINDLLKATDNERRDNIKNDLKEKIEKEIKYLYFAASGVKTENYLSRLILGQMLATEVPNGSKHIFIHNNQDFYFYDKDGIRKGKNSQVSTFVIKKQSESFVFSIIEYTGQEEKYNLASKLATRGQKAAQEAEIFENKLVSSIGNKYTQLNIKVEASSELMIDVSCISDFSDKKYQGSLVAIEDVTVDSFFDMKTGNKKDVTIEDQESQNETVKLLEGALFPHKGLIESESHFQAVMQGLLMNYKKEDKKTLVFTEANPSGQGRIDLVVSLFRENDNERKIIVIELKYANGKPDSQNKFNEAKEQVEKYKTNLKTFSDEKKFTALYIVFNTGAQNNEQLIYYGAMLDGIEHTSQSESRSESSAECSSEDESKRKEEIESQTSSLLGQKRPFSELESGGVEKRIKGLSLAEQGKVVRLGDMCNQHGDYPQSPCIEGSYDVFINGRSVHRQGDKWSPHASTDPYKPPHLSQFLLKGSNSVFVNGKAIARVGDLISCGAKVETGSNNVFAG